MPVESCIAPKFRAHIHVPNIGANSCSSKLCMSSISFFLLGSCLQLVSDEFFVCLFVFPRINRMCCTQIRDVGGPNRK